MSLFFLVIAPEKRQLGFGFLGVPWSIPCFLLLVFVSGYGLCGGAELKIKLESD